MGGGLYQLFDSLGNIFFTMLIGHERASLSNLRISRTYTGGVLFFSFFFILFFLFKRTDWFDKFSIYSVISFGFGAGIIGGIIIATILNIYVYSIEEVEKYRIKYQQKYDELVASGLPSIEAEKQAEKYAKGSICFIASSVYGSTNSPEVIFLRQWRDKFLVPSFSGRLILRIYYFLSPYIAQIIRDSYYVRIFFLHIIDKVISILKNVNTK